MRQPECNYCGNKYDPLVRHTCAGNDIWPVGRREDAFDPPIAGEDAIGFRPLPTSISISTMNDIGAVFCTVCNKRLSAEEWARHPDHENGLTRQQVGEALDEDRRGALGLQTGGDHYRKLPIQPVEYIIANGIGFLAGNIIKYATRYKDKGGAEDIRKIKHYCELILEFEYKEE